MDTVLLEAKAASASDSHEAEASRGRLYLQALIVASLTAPDPAMALQASSQDVYNPNLNLNPYLNL